MGGILFLVLKDPNGGNISEWIWKGLRKKGLPLFPKLDIVVGGLWSWDAQ